MYLCLMWGLSQSVGTVLVCIRVWLTCLCDCASVCMYVYVSIYVICVSEYDTSMIVRLNAPLWYIHHECPFDVCLSVVWLRISMWYVCLSVSMWYVVVHLCIRCVCLSVSSEVSVSQCDCASLCDIQSCVCVYVMFVPVMWSCSCPLVWCECLSVWYVCICVSMWYVSMKFCV